MEKQGENAKLPCTFTVANFYKDNKNMYSTAVCVVEDILENCPQDSVWASGIMSVSI